MDLAEIEAEIPPRVLDQLRALPLVRGRPLLAVDADEVLVPLASHLSRFVAAHGIEMRLERYQLEGTMFPNGSDHPLAFDETLGWIDRFFRDEVLNQTAMPGAADALAALAEVAQIMVLTNVPAHGREGRVANLASLGMGYPLVENAGGKGRALAWLSAKVAAPVVFIDDSPGQIDSAARRAPDVLRIHFAGAEGVAHLIPDCAAAQHRVADWPTCRALIDAHLTTHRTTQATETTDENRRLHP